MLFAGAGAVSAWLAHAAYDHDWAWLTVMVSAAVLVPGVGLLWWAVTRWGWARVHWSAQRGAWLLVALPFPYTLMTELYGSRTAWVPDAVQDYLNSPTAYLLVVCGGLALSLVWTNWVLQRALAMADQQEEAETVGALRTVSIALFVLMPAVSLLGDPVWISDLFEYVLAPLGTMLYAAVLGREIVRERRGGALLLR